MSKLSSKEIIESIKQCTLIEINELVKAIEEEFQVSANFAFAAPAASGADESSTPSEQNLHLVSAGTNKIAVIKVIRELTGLGLMDAKKLVDTPGLIKEAVSSSQFEELKAKFTEAGATIEFK